MDQMLTCQPHTHIPHVPRHTQPSTFLLTRSSPHPILQSRSDASRNFHAQTQIVGLDAPGLASVEYCFDDAAARAGEQGSTTSYQAEWSLDERMRMIREAEEWEARERDKAGVGLEELISEEAMVVDSTPAA